jgi:biopolymer transport protein TolR
MPSLVNRGRGRRTINEINMVPFIDVMLVLLIIFMVTAPLIAPSMINLPSVGKGAKQPDLVIQIIVGKDESLTLKSMDKAQDKASPIALKDLVRAVKAAQNARPEKAGASGAAVDSAVVISADRTVKYETVVKVMDVLQRAGVQRVGLSVQLVN